MVKMDSKILLIYKRLLREYGAQGWWPLLDYKGTNPTKTGSIKGYHPGDYSFPRNESEKYEIICGALLTQNTAWRNVELSLRRLKDKFDLKPERIVNANEEELKECIKSCGYFNQKAQRLKELTRFFINLHGRTPEREELLAIKGVGPETADSILLYAYKIPTFVIDNYTRRIFISLGLIEDSLGYNEIKDIFESHLPKDYRIYQEYHALLVEHAKRYYSKDPKEDFLKEITTNKWN